MFFGSSSRMDSLFELKIQLRTIFAVCTLISGLHFQCAVSDCGEYGNASRTFLDGNQMATECIKLDTISTTFRSGSVRNGEPTEAEFRHDNRFDHSTRFIYSFAFDATLVNSSRSSSVDENITQNSLDYSFDYSSYNDLLPVFQLANSTSALFSLSVEFLPLFEVEWVTILKRTQDESSFIHENTFYFTIDPPLQVSGGEIKVSVWLTGYQWPDITSANGNGYLKFLQCIDGQVCDVFRDTWRNRTIEYGHSACPEPYSADARAYLQICHNTTIGTSAATTVPVSWSDIPTAVAFTSILTTHETTPTQAATTKATTILTTTHDVQTSSPARSVLTEADEITYTLKPTLSATTAANPLDQLDQDLQRLANETVTKVNVADVAEELTVLVANDTELDVQNLESINEVLTKITDVNDPSEEVTQSVVILVNDILNSYVDDSSPDDSIPEAPNQIQRAFESQISARQTQPGDFIKEEANVAIRAVKIPLDSATDGRLVFETVSRDGNTLGENSTNIRTGEEPKETEDGISFQLPREIINVYKGNQSTDLPVSFIIYQNSNLFPSAMLANESRNDIESQRVVASRIISATIEGLQIQNLPSTHLVELYFAINQETYNAETEEIHCVFWDNNANNGLGDWSNAGCGVNQSSSEGRVVCHCNHLTSFAVLVDRFGTSSPYILDAISKVGCGLSIVCLFVTVLTYISNRSLRKNKPQQILICFCSTLLSLYVVFLVGIERTNPQNGCIAVSILLHYLTLSTILWMAVEAFTMYINFVKVVGVHIEKFMLKASATAWGLPAVIVLVIGIVDIGQYRNTEYCFIRIDYAFYFTQVPLLGVTIVFNMYVFIHVMYRITCGRLKSRSSSRNKREARREETKKRVQNALAISSLLGLTWVFGLLSLIHQDAAFTFAILFCIFNSLQGLFVFVMFCVCNKEVRNKWIACFCCRGTRNFSQISSISDVTSGNTAKTGSSTGHYTKADMASSQLCTTRANQADDGEDQYELQKNIELEVKVAHICNTLE